MALGSILGGGVMTGSAPTVLPASVRGVWTTCHDNLSATAENSTVLLKPYSAVTSTLHWVKVPEGCTRVYIRPKNTATMSGVTTSPVVRLFGAYLVSPGSVTEQLVASTPGFSGTPGDTNHALFIRVDNVDANAAGITLTLATTGNIEDATFEYGDLPSLDGYDLKGAHYFAMLTETAAVIVGVGAVVYGECMFL